MYLNVLQYDGMFNIDALMDKYVSSVLRSQQKCAQPLNNDHSSIFTAALTNTGVISTVKARGLGAVKFSQRIVCLYEELPTPK